MSDEPDAEPAEDAAAEEVADDATDDASPDAGATAETGDATEESTDAADVETGDEETGATETEEADGLQEGDFVRLQYSIRTVEDGSLVDTTDEEIAEEEGIETEDREFGPRTVVLGAGHVFDAVEDDIYGSDVGASGTVEVPAAEAFGEYDPDEVNTVSVDKIPEDDRFPGAHVDLDGQHGHVETIIGGRARVDFNHPLAGDDLEYDYEVVEVVEDRVERAQGLLGMYVDVDLDLSIDTEEEEEAVYDDEGDEEGTETVEYETLYIEAVPQLAMNQQWLFQKQQIAQDIIDRIGVDRVVVREVLDGGGMMGGMGGMMGGMGGGDVGAEELEEAIDDEDLEDVDAEEVLEELDVDESDATEE